MRDFEIDGVFVQRFAILAAKEHNSFRLLRSENRKLQLCRDSANRHGRAYALMYDLSGLTDDDFPRLARDWKELRTRMELGTDPHDKAYLQLNGKPLVGIWGVGFNDDRKYLCPRRKKVLNKVSFDKNLFRKELSKSVRWLSKKEVLTLKIWALTTFSQYKNIILEVFDQIS